MRVRSLQRRCFITALFAVVLSPVAVYAQQSERMRRVGALFGWPETDPATRAIVNAFTQALEHYGWVEGKNIRIEYRFAAGDPTLFKTYASELVASSPDVIIASTGTAVVALRDQAHYPHRRGTTP
jgi:putative ABC transport system substrate-binding protein